MAQCGAILNELHNIDKHRALNLTTAVASDAITEWEGGEGAMMKMIIGNSELRDGAIYGDIAMPFYSTAMRDRFRQMKVQGQATIFIAFDKPTADELEPWRVDSVLQEILEFVRDTVVPSFEPFFD